MSSQPAATDEPLGPGDYPALFHSTDQGAIRDQAAFLRATRFRLGALAVAAAGGSFALKAGSFDLAGVLSLVAFIAALIGEVYLLVASPQQGWYEARAAAESSKTLAWRYMVRGAPFGGEARSEAVDAAFLDQLKDLISGLQTVPPAAAEAGTGSQITERMRAVRQGDLAARRAFYRRHRIEEQQRWYQTKSADQRTASRRWQLATVVIEFGGIAAATVKAFGVADVDGLGLVSAVAAGIAAWVQAKQYDQQSKAYYVAAQELAAINSLIDHDRDESAWAGFVNEAEEAISREHTLWRSSRSPG